MIGWGLWFFVALHLFLAEGWVGSLGLPAPDAAVAICAFCVLFARPAAIPGILLCAAVGRAVVLPGGLAIQVLAMAAPVAVLLPIRGLFFRRNYLWQCTAVAFFALTVPRCAALLARLFAQAVPPSQVDFSDVAWAVALLPPLLWLLRRLPPLSLFTERSE